MPDHDTHQTDILQPRRATALGGALRRSGAALGLALLAIAGVACPSAQEEGAGGENGEQRDDQQGEQQGDEPGAGGFAGDADLLGTWDATIEFEEEIFDCTAEISAALAFTVTCNLDPGEYDVGCDQTLDILRFTGSVSAGTGGIQIDEVWRYDGPQCESYGLSAGRDIEEHDSEAALTRIEAGLGSLGGRWTSEIYEWSCVDDDCTETVLETSPEMNCTFELSNSGHITASCNEGPSDDPEECVETLSVDGSIGNGRLQLTLTESSEGADCGSDDGGTISAVRR